jgi:hypothetical protein
MKTMIALLIAISAMLAFSAVTATASMIVPASESGREHSPVIGANGELDRVDFIHYAKPPAGSKPGNANSCYKLMGVKWPALPVAYVINPSNSGLSQAFVTQAISTSAETWDAATSKELFNNAYSVNYNAKYGVLDQKNSIAFGSYPNSNVIAVTSVWYTRVGKQIVEFDQLYNTQFTWGDATSNPAVMDLQNIATHELGHSVGLDDIYSTSCSDVTMYGYSTNGETSKRSLEAADITGLKQIYGA